MKYTQFNEIFKTVTEHLPGKLSDFKVRQAVTYSIYGHGDANKLSCVGRDRY
jgi:hypothetical protein